VVEIEYSCTVISNTSLLYFNRKYIFRIIVKGLKVNNYEEDIRNNKKLKTFALILLTIFWGIVFSIAYAVVVDLSDLFFTLF
jgi:hypothetical protein